MGRDITSAVLKSSNIRDQREHMTISRFILSILMFQKNNCDKMQ